MRGDTSPAVTLVCRCSTLAIAAIPDKWAVRECRDSPLLPVSVSSTAQLGLIQAFVILRILHVAGDRVCQRGRHSMCPHINETSIPCTSIIDVSQIFEIHWINVG